MKGTVLRPTPPRSFTMKRHFFRISYKTSKKLQFTSVSAHYWQKRKNANEVTNYCQMRNTIWRFIRYCDPASLMDILTSLKLHYKLLFTLGAKKCTRYIAICIFHWHAYQMTQCRESIIRAYDPFKSAVCLQNNLADFWTMYWLI